MSVSIETRIYFKHQPGKDIERA